MEGKQGYLKGMNQDSSYSKRDNNSYYSATNFKVVTDGGSSSGSLETEKGNKISFKLPNVSEMTLTDGTIIPAQHDLHIIGSTTLVDEIIIFSTNETSPTPNGYGQIWVCKYDEATDTIIGIDAVTNELVASSHLIYNQKLSFSTDYRIGRAIALFETEEKKRVYWTDNYNQVRVFNLADPNSFDVPVATVDLFPGVSLAQPTVTGVINGSITSGTQIAVTYRLLKASGGETGYAPPTPMYPLNQSSTDAFSYSSFAGGGTSASRGLSYSITGLDTTYEAVQHIAILYNADGTLANIWQFKEEGIPSNGYVEVAVTELNETVATIIPLEEYAIINKGFDTAKDIEVQGNRLIAANIGTKDFALDEWDARAYRFNAPGGQYTPVSPVQDAPSTTGFPVALLQDSTDNTQDVVLLGGTATPDWDSVPEKHDAINIHNDEANADWFTADQTYKYQKDGSTLGGSGKFVSYKFVTQGVSGHTWRLGLGTTTAPEHYTPQYFDYGTAPLYSGALEADGSLKPIYRENQTDTMSAPWAHANFSGYSRGETYRFAVVLYDKKGTVGFVKWIGDIRFPDARDKGGAFNIYTSVLTEATYGTVYLQQLGIEFTVDVSTIADKISGYSIVRLERTTANKKNLGSGIHMFYDAMQEDYSNTIMHSWYISGLGLGSGNPANDPFEMSCRVHLDGSNDNVLMHLHDKIDISAYGYLTPKWRRMGYLISPLGQVDQSYGYKAGDYIEHICHAGAYATTYLENPGGPGGAGGDSQTGVYYKIFSSQDIAAYENAVTDRVEVKYGQILRPGEIIRAPHPLLPSLNPVPITYDLAGNGQDNNPGVHNSSYSRHNTTFTGGSKELHPLGIGNTKLFYQLNTEEIPGSGITTTTPHMATAAHSGAFWFNGTRNYRNQSGGPGLLNGVLVDFAGNKYSNAPMVGKLVSYRRYLENQYGGNSYESRSTNEYLYIGHFQMTKDLPAANNLSTKVFGGDTYVNYYDSEQIEAYNDDAMPIHTNYKPQDTNRLSVAVCVPCESSVNTEMRTGNVWRRNRTDFTSYSQNNNSIYAGWMGEDRVQKKYFAEDFLSQFVENHPNQLWASDTKLNGELFDSWRRFPIANKTEVDGIYGPINRILSFKDNLMYYQDRAFGIASLDERSVINDQSGQSLVLGEGGVFPDYRYLSTKTGTIHQFSVVPTDSAVYHYDARQKKFMKYAGGVQPISDLKGLNSWFAANMNGSLSNVDKTLRANGLSIPLGVHGVYDQRYNRVLYTFLNDNKVYPVNYWVNPNASFGSGLGSDNYYVIPAGSFTMSNGTVYYNATEQTVPVSQPQAEPDFFDPDKFEPKSAPNITLSYNEMLGAFESFYDYHPKMYLEYGRRLFSVDPNNPNALYQHNAGTPGEFYGIKSTSELHTIFTQPADVNKIWNNIAFVNEAYDANGNDLYNETFDTMQFKNNYQDTGEITITSDNMKRRMRTWRAAIPRETDKELSRMRNPWLEMILKYNNDSGIRKVIHDVIYSFTPTKL